MVAVKLLMKEYAFDSNNPKDIKGIEVSNGKFCDFYSVADLYCYLKKYPNVIITVQGTKSRLIPVRATNGEMYIRSEPNERMTDSLMSLPRM